MDYIGETNYFPTKAMSDPGNCTVPWGVRNIQTLTSPPGLLEQSLFPHSRKAITDLPGRTPGGEAPVSRFRALIHPRDDADGETDSPCLPGHSWGMSPVLWEAP